MGRSLDAHRSALSRDALLRLTCDARILVLDGDPQQPIGVGRTDLGTSSPCAGSITECCPSKAGRSSDTRGGTSPGSVRAETPSP